VPLISPGRPPIAGRYERRRFWVAIAAGMASEDAAVEAGVSQAAGTRWFRKAGGMPPSMFRKSAKPLFGRYLSFAEREEIALLRAQDYSMQEIGRRLGRPPSTISRELRGNAATRSGGRPRRQYGVVGTAGASSCAEVLSYFHRDVGLAFLCTIAAPMRPNAPSLSK
jgi:hypothetical protein